MLDLRIYKSTFEAGHFIEGHPKCGVQHGHSYRLTVNLQSNLDKWQDFADIKKDVDEYVQVKLDHQFLGNASAEEISAWIGHHMEQKGYRGWLELFETDKFGVLRHFASDK
jgi:6-pyruvoyl-tetrahydropterin synthase